MTDHPLTRKKCWEIYVEKVSGESWETIPDIETSFRTCMRAAYDLGRNEQLVEAIKWLDENIANYHYRHYYDTGEYPRPNRRWDKLTEHLKEAMRPQEDS